MPDWSVHRIFGSSGCTPVPAGKEEGAGLMISTRTSAVKFLLFITRLRLHYKVSIKHSM